MLQQFVAEGFGINSQGADGPRTFLLTDEDVVRGDDANEFVGGNPIRSFGIFDGFFGFPGVLGAFEDGEMRSTVTFRDGTELSGVRGLFDIIPGPFGQTIEYFLLDQSTLGAAGRTMAEVVDISVDAFIDHDLSWADLGFTPTGVMVPPPPPPLPDPVLNLVEGTDGNDVLRGTNGDDLIIGGDGDDRLIGRNGGDTFVFGADTRDGNLDRDVITDFDLAEDTIFFEAGAVIRFIEERGNNLFIQLEGDRDAIVVRDSDRGAVSAFDFSDDLFLG